jgi:hypothetical protein
MIMVMENADQGLSRSLPERLLARADFVRRNID